MKIRKQNGPPEDLIYFDEDLNLTQSNVEDVVEIFNTPLTGSYNWDCLLYTSPSPRDRG